MEFVGPLRIPLGSLLLRLQKSCNKFMRSTNLSFPTVLNVCSFSVDRNVAHFDYYHMIIVIIKQERGGGTGAGMLKKEKM